jgi:FMN reductase
MPFAPTPLRTPHGAQPSASGILAIAGSPSQYSRSSELLHYATRKLENLGFGLDRIALRDLPAQDLIEGRYGGSAASTLRSRVARARAVLIASPVYKASFSGALKAMLDLLDEKALAGKIVLPIVTGGSPAHLLAIEYGLKPVLSALGACHILAGIYATDKQIVIDDTGRARIAEDVRNRLDDSIRRLSEDLEPAAAPSRQSLPERKQTSQSVF